MHSNTRKNITIAAAVIICAIVSVSWTIVYARQALMMVRILPPLAVTEDGDIDYHTTALAPITVFPHMAVEGMESIYEIGIPVGRAIPQGGTVTLLFPSGFQLLDLCRTIHSSQENKDINGAAPGSVPIAFIACAPSTFRVIVTLGGAVREREYLHFFIQGIVNPSENSDRSQEGRVVGVEVRGINGDILELITSLPFFLTRAGTLKISGTIFNDNGAGLLGFSGDGVRSGSEPGLADAQVCLEGSNGSRCLKTDSAGTYSFSGLRNGSYSVVVPALPSGSLVGGPFHVDVELVGGNNKTDLDFGFVPAGRTITIKTTNIPDQSDVKVFAFGGAGVSTSIVRDVLWNGQTTRSIELPVFDGIWNIGVESINSISSSFIAPSQKQIIVSGDGVYTEIFYLRSAELRIRGRVVDSNRNGISKVYITATQNPRTETATKELATHSVSDGSFEIAVTAGSYRLDVSMPGMPTVQGIDVRAAYDSGNSAIDNNGNADIYRDGVLITNNGRGGVSDLVFVIPKGERSISGRVLDESGGPVPFAVVGAEEISEEGRVIGAYIERTTDATGAFTLFVTDGRFNIRAIAPVPGDIPDKIVNLSGKNVSGQDMRISLAQYGMVKGTITKSGRGVAGAFVNVSGAAGTGTATTDIDGNYSIRVKAGSGYTIEATIRGAGRIAPIENVTVGVGATVDQKNFSINAPGMIVVTITGVTDAIVDARDQDSNGDGTVLNPVPGQYRVSVLPGTYTVTAQNPQYGAIGKKTGVVVTPGGTASLSFAPPVSLLAQGTVASRLASCVDGATVSVVDTANGRLVETITSDGGRYVLRLLAGIYALTVSKKGCVDGDTPLFFAVKDKPVTIENRVITPASSPVSGIVQVAGKHVSFETKVVAESTSGAIQSTSVDTTVQSGNNYTLNLTEGSWTIFARADGYESSRHAVLVGEAGRTLNLVLATIPGHVQTERVTTPFVPSKGGVVKNTDAGEGFAIVLPAGSLGGSSDSGSISTKVTTAVVTKTPTAEVIGGKGIEIMPKDATGKSITSLATNGNDVKISVPYSRVETAAFGIDEKKLMLAVWSDSTQQWTPFATTVDTANAVLSGAPPHFSVFAPIALKAPPTPVAFLPSEAPIEETRTVSPIQGAVLLPPLQPKEKILPQQEQEIDREETIQGAEPLILSAPPLIERDAPGSSANQSSSIQESGKRAKSEQVKSPLGRFPQNRTYVVTVTQAKTSIPDTDKTSTLKEVFEMSIAITDDSRRLIGSKKLVINGEMIKSTATRESIPLRFIIARNDGVRIFDQKEEITFGNRMSFTKNIELSDDISEGHYTITVEAAYRGDTISSADQFSVERLVVQPARAIQEITSAPNNDNASGISLLALFALLLTICAAAHVWYTLWKVFHRKA